MSQRDDVLAYADAVLAGKVPACRLVRQACARHRRDWQLTQQPRGHPAGFSFDLTAVERAVRFFACLHHSKGEWAGSAIHARAVAGLHRRLAARLETGQRHPAVPYRLPRGAAKKWQVDPAGRPWPLWAGDGSRGRRRGVLRGHDARPGQDRVGRGRAHARPVAVFGQSGAQVCSSLAVEETHSKMVPLGADADVLDGLNPHVVIIDELHAHRTRAVLDVMDSATGARREPLLVMITTAGTDRTSVCWEQHAYAERVLAGTVEDNSLFCYIATIDEGDDWREEASWIKANPNFGVTVKPDYLERRAAKATKVPAAQNGFRRLHLNEWTEAAETWLTAGVWEAVQASALDLTDYRGRPAWLAVDLSSKRDLTALMVVVESFDARGDSLLLAFPRFWMPADGVVERSERDGVDYATWRDHGLITVTPGPVVDVAYVAAAIVELSEELDVQGVVGDAYRRPELQAELEELGCTVPLIDHPQGYRKAAGSDLWMPGSVEATENAILERRIRIASSPVLTWNVASVCMVADAQENRKPNKLKSTGRIDGALALIMAVGTMLRGASAERSPEYQLLFV